MLTVITGQHRSGVISARTRIDVLLLTFRRKQPFTHFLSFFLNEAEVQERFLKFQEEVLEKCSMVSNNRTKLKVFLLFYTLSSIRKSTKMAYNSNSRNIHISSPTEKGNHFWWFILILNWKKYLQMYQHISLHVLQKYPLKDDTKGSS